MDEVDSSAEFEAQLEEIRSKIRSIKNSHDFQNDSNFGDLLNEQINSNMGDSCSGF